MRPFGLLAAPLAIILNIPASAQSPIQPADAFEFLNAKVNDSVIETEIISKKSITFRFVRLDCEVFDGSNRLLGSYLKDFGSHSRLSAVGVGISAREYWRPTMRLPQDVEKADHASCRFATRSDPLPKVDPNDIIVTLTSPSSAEIVNRSPFFIGGLSMSCTGTETGGNQWTMSYEAPSFHPEGDPPNIPRTVQLNDQRPTGWTGKMACAVVVAKASTIPAIYNYSR